MELICIELNLFQPEKPLTLPFMHAFLLLAHVPVISCSSAHSSKCQYEMDRSLFWFIVAFSILITSWLIFLCKQHLSGAAFTVHLKAEPPNLWPFFRIMQKGLSTCLGEPIRLLLCHLWEKLLDYADKQPTPASVLKWSKRGEGNDYTGIPYSRLGREQRRFNATGGGLNSFGPGGRYEEEEEEYQMEMMDWKRRRG